MLNSLVLCLVLLLSLVRYNADWEGFDELVEIFHDVRNSHIQGLLKLSEPRFLSELVVWEQVLAFRQTVKAVWAWKLLRSRDQAPFKPIVH
jgi:hypothetical protein